MALSREAGHLGQVQSLGGLWSKEGSGRISEQLNPTVTTTAAVSLFNENQRRICALIINKSGGTLTLDFGGSGTYSIALIAGENFQIDEKFPWAGVVMAIAETANCTVWTNEVSIEQST